MKCFVPVSDDMLFSGEDLRRYRLVPWNPDFRHIKTHRQGVNREKQLHRRKRGRHENP